MVMVMMFRVLDRHRAGLHGGEDRLGANEALKGGWVQRPAVVAGAGGEGWPMRRGHTRRRSETASGALVERA
eukprot:scaffold161950_cov17-Tisochrysis_lutea.AAC.1